MDRKIKRNTSNSLAALVSGFTFLCIFLGPVYSGMVFVNTSKLFFPTSHPHGNSILRKS